MSRGRRIKGARMRSGQQTFGLSAGITVEDIVKAFTEKGEQFQFPVAAIPVKVDKETQNTLLLAAGILALGGVAMSMVLRK